MLPVNILIVEDNPRLAKSLKDKVLTGENHFRVVNIVHNGKEAIELLKENDDISCILMDINMPVLNGIKATEIISESHPDIKIIMSTIFDDDDNLLASIKAGAKGYLLKEEDAVTIQRSIFDVLDGGAPMSSTMALKVLTHIKQENQGPTTTFDLTERELEVLSKLSEGHSYSEIGMHLFISSGTVRKHIERIYAKMQVHSKVEAVQKANKFRLFK